MISKQLVDSIWNRYRKYWQQRLLVLVFRRFSNLTVTSLWSKQGQCQLLPSQASSSPQIHLMILNCKLRKVIVDLHILNEWDYCTWVSALIFPKNVSWVLPVHVILTEETLTQAGFTPQLFERVRVRNEKFIVVIVLWHIHTVDLLGTINIVNCMNVKQNINKSCDSFQVIITLILTNSSGVSGMVTWAPPSLLCVAMEWQQTKGEEKA